MHIEEGEEIVTQGELDEVIAELIIPQKKPKSTDNSHVRRYRGEIADGGMYRKIYDYVWECD